jgi:transposase
MRPGSIVGFAAKHAPCTVAMEACCGAHFLGRLLLAQGHTVKLMPPEYVRPYVKAQKNDDRDAEAIAEAATRPTMRFVALKCQEQLDIQSLHRVRSRLARARTTLINQMRAMLLERGITAAQGRRKFEKALDAMFADEAALVPGRLPYKFYIKLLIFESFADIIDHSHVYYHAARLSLGSMRLSHS